jgi:hypothetical protein
MKRDMEIIRQILLNVEDDKYVLGQTVRLPGIPDEVCGHHVALILDAGLAIGHLHRTDSHGIVGADVERLTSAGHDFCEGIRHDTIWNKVKIHVLKPGAAYTLSTVIEYVKVQIHQQVFGTHPS